MGLHKGLLVGSWKVLGKLDSGGMGEVWKVEHQTLHREGALKCVHEHMLKEVAGSHERFLTEARTVLKVRHPNVVEVLDAGVIPDPDAAEGSVPVQLPWLVMELLVGHHLGKEMKARGKDGLPPGEVAAIFREVCDGLQAAHDKGVVHCDLKPENLFVANVEGRRVMKVVDFGIAKAMSEGRNSITLTHRLLSPVWTSPEQLHGQKVTRAADVWALGLVAFYLLTGKFYWRAANGELGEGKDPVAVLTTEIIASLKALPAASARAAELGAAGRLPPGFDAWFARCVCADAAARYARVSECAAALSALLGERPSQAAVASTAPYEGVASVPSLGTVAMVKAGVGLPPPQGAVATAPVPPKRVRWQVPAAGVVAAALVALAAWKTLAGDGAKRMEGDAGGVRADAAAVVDAAPVLRCPDDMVLIPAGRFQMGTEGDGGGSDERPRHEVRLAAFCIDRTEVRVARYRACVAAGVCTAATTANWQNITSADHRTYDRQCNARYPDRDEHPMNCIDWTQARDLLRVVGARGIAGRPSAPRRLLREAEWEYAARGTDGRVYPWGNEAPG